MSRRGWPAVASGSAALPRPGSHLLAVVLNLLGWAAVGGALMALAPALRPVAPAAADLVDFIGFYALTSFWLGWLGYLIGVPLLHRMLRRGRGGWAVVLAGGLAVGLICSVPVHLAAERALAPLGWVVAGFGPPMALSYAALLRAVTRRRQG